MTTTDIRPITVRAEDLKRGDKIFQIPNELVITDVADTGNGTIIVHVNDMFEQHVDLETQFQIVRQPDPAAGPLHILKNGPYYWTGDRWSTEEISARRYTEAERKNIHGLGLPMDGIWVEFKEQP